MERLDNYVDGQWVASDSTRPNLNPSDLSDTVAIASVGDAGLVDQAVDAACRAQPRWAATSPQQRADLLEAVAGLILARVDPLGELLAREEGKTLAEAKAEVVRAGQIFRFFSGEALRLVGEHQDSTRPGVTVTTSPEPLGVVGVITPWNFPIAIPAWKTAPALAYGNTVVIKPAELVPSSAHALATILDEVGFPPGVFNLVLGSGSVVGSAIVEHQQIDGVTFTGSETVGTSIAAQLAARLIPVQLELGGKNPLVVADDADVDVAVECAVNGAFFATGQRCTASSRLIVTDGIHDRFVAAMLERMSRLRVGPALDPRTEIGPVVDDRQLATDVEYLELARAGSGVVHGGVQPQQETSGHFLEPALVLGLDNSSRVNREEVFGPVAGVLRAGDFDEAMALANDTPFGLVAGICTTSLRLAAQFKRRADAGMVMVNLPTAGVDPHVAFGGRKRSSYGPKEQGSHAREFFTQSKTIYEQA